MRVRTSQHGLVRSSRAALQQRVTSRNKSHRTSEWVGRYARLSMKGRPRRGPRRGLRAGIHRLQERRGSSTKWPKEGRTWPTTS